MNKSYIGGTLSTFQWFIFLLANAIALPIVIGGAFGLSIEEIASLMQRVFFIVGISSFLQGVIGHRLPLADGPAGSWVSIFVMLAAIALQQTGDPQSALPLLMGAVFFAGILLVILGLTGLVQKILFLFSPLVTGTFLLLLGLQLSGVFLEGMLAVSGDPAVPDYGMVAIAFFVFILVILLSNKGRGWVKSYAVLIGILAGWIIALITGKASISSPAQSSVFKLPELFAWGMPQLNAGMIVTAILFSFLIISNTIAAVTAVSQSIGNDTRNYEKTINRSLFTGGISHFLAAGFSSLAVVPLPVTAGFLQMTGEKKIKPFLIASIALAVLALIPSIVHVLSLLPGPIASAALMASFINLIAIALTSLTKEVLDHRRLSILGITFLVSMGIMFLPAGIFSTLPSVIQDVVSNGLLVGTILVILLEQLWKPQRETETTKN
ncbi:purine/pyrimidine permease [Aciduricibacillus chroicocephali]|uniref:Purine/pyrimidine permease n=1 Tax=Aciduricibacillus chroicocephali TaxID=3054939 RepID=A0ABY9KSV7_9BACI|nr:purine/pyrimidine permease [Bacillaceae bacterium 44XB]